ncbi:MAG: DUF4912 domain-containing protein [Candidatus Rifleibacteriota bacterium]
MNKKFSLEQLQALKKTELYQLAQECKIKGRSKLNKAQLIKELSKYAETENNKNSASGSKTKLSAKKASDKIKSETKQKNKSKTSNSEKKDKKDSKKQIVSSRESKNEKSEKSPARKILDRSFAKSEKEFPRKKGAQVKPVAIPLNLSVNEKSKSSSKKAQQIEQERSKRHSSLKTTMEIPVFSAPEPESAKPLSENDFTGDLPADYGETKIVVQIRDPHWAHAYWQIPRSEYRKLEQDVGIFEFAHSHFVLKLHNVSDGFTREFDISEHARSHYFYLEKSDTVYQVELGLSCPTEGYCFVALSNLVQTPPDTVASVWAFPADRDPAKKCLDDQDRIAGHERPTVAPSMVQLPVNDCFDEFKEVEELKEINDPTYVLNQGSAQPESVEGRKIESGAGLIDNPEQNIEEKPEELNFPPSSVEARGVPSSPELAAPERSVSSDFSSPEDMDFYKNANEPSLFLQADAEMILFGKVQTTAELTFNKEHLDYNENGEFSLRLALPWNQQKPLELEAFDPKTGLKKRFRASMTFEVIDEGK